MNALENHIMSAWEAVGMIYNHKHLPGLEDAFYIAKHIRDISHPIVNDRGEHIIDMLDRYVVRCVGEQCKRNTGYAFLHDICELSDETIERLIDISDVCDDYSTFFREWTNEGLE